MQRGVNALCVHGVLVLDGRETCCRAHFAYLLDRLLAWLGEYCVLACSRAPLLCLLCHLLLLCLLCLLYVLCLLCLLCLMSCAALNCICQQTAHKRTWGRAVLPIFDIYYTFEGNQPKHNMWLDMLGPSAVLESWATRSAMDCHRRGVCRSWAAWPGRGGGICIIYTDIIILYIMY